MTSKIKVWARWFHLYTALVLCVPLVLIGLTGSVLVYEDEIQAWTGSVEPIRATADGPISSLDRLIAAAQEAAPNNARATSLSLPSAAGQPAMVGFGGGRGGAQVLLDPASAAVIASRSGPPRPPGLMRDIFLLHANLLNLAGGRATIGWLGIAMCAIGLTGLVLWWPKRGRIAKAFAVARGIVGQRLLSELHGAIGIWSFVVFMVVSFSGVYLAFPQETNGFVRTVFQSEDVGSAARALRVTPDERPLPSLDRISEIARGAVDDADFRAINLPSQPNLPYRVTLAPRGIFADGRGPLVAVYVDPFAQRVLTILDPRDYPLGEKIVVWQRPLHEGEGLGPIFKFLVFLSGLLPLFFSVTGLWMWLIRRRRRRAAV